jgi:hypothetical protein
MEFTETDTIRDLIVTRGYSTEYVCVEMSVVNSK